ncbi:TniB family NTP-binding protein [Stenotrophomonas maltophilia]|uniref:TniB family NTP-binding protein n=1 Tax=Stenotrophomonas maltophilia TaxID=40324 RepID=UPI0021C01D69|nr:TniB family NTP-binding protein [Stenotrophomonas maltophilia]UXL29514.1 TniB family NTP-binding protein [Stenotrophomonas maltophilia]
MSVEHLLPEVAAILEEPNQSRIEFCRQDRWVGYTAATKALDELDDLRNFPKNLRPNNILLVARSGNGKSSILDYFANRHPIGITNEGKPVVPVLKLEMPSKPDESEFWSLILWILGISHRESDRTAHKKRQAKSAMVYANVQMLALDEFNNVAEAGRATADLLAAIRNLSNELRIPIVAAGTEKAINALNLDPQLKSRFEPIGLPQWKLDREYRGFLAAYEQLLPLVKPSGLASRELATTLFAMAGGTVGQNVKLLRRASVEAIESGTEQITPELLRGLEWTRADGWDVVARSV